MTDGMAANNPGSGISVIQLHCLTHAMPHFFDIKTSFPKIGEYVLKELSKVWKAKSEAKKMSQNERLAYHQKNSHPVMESPGRWLMVKLESGEIEYNSGLGKTANYMLKRWVL